LLIFVGCLDRCGIGFLPCAILKDVAAVFFSGLPSTGARAVTLNFYDLWAIVFPKRGTHSLLVAAVASVLPGCNG
jgi:hypothetical protein